MAVAGSAAVLAAVAVSAMLLTIARARPATAEVSARDGYGPDGTYQVHVELDPYLWLPATSGTIRLGNGATVDVSRGVPTIAQLTSVLTGAFMGTGLVRYGPWSGVLSIDYVGLSQTRSIAPDSLGVARSLKLGATMTRIAPGIGYQVYNGALGALPATLDGQVGFAWYAASTTLDLYRDGPGGPAGVAGVSGSSALVQPWLGLRGAIYPAPRWRIALDALVQGFGVDGGTWGWETDITATWAATRWLNLMAGFRALSSDLISGQNGAVRSIRLIGYGPLLGVGFIF